MANMQMVPATKNIEPQYVEMMVPLYSFGCEKKIKKSLSHLKGIYSVNVDFKEQKVTVWGICNKYDVLATVQTKRKGARFWNQDDNIAFQQLLQTRPTSPNSSSPLSATPILKQPNSRSLIKVRSLSLKAWKKVFFTRSFSF